MIYNKTNIKSLPIDLNYEDYIIQAKSSYDDFLPRSKGHRPHLQKTCRQHISDMIKKGWIYHIMRYSPERDNNQRYPDQDYPTSFKGMYSYIEP
jgi:hypothetical protein